MMLIICGGACGCALLSPGYERLLSKPMANELNAEQVADFEDKSAPVRRIVRLDAAMISAPDTDRRLRSLVWEELDESGPMAPEDRRRLNQSGIRVGVAGSSLPWALESLLKAERSASLSEAGASQSSFSTGNTLAIAEGSRSTLELPNNSESIVIPEKRIVGLHAGGELAGGRCVLEVSAIEYGDGWAVLKLVPQLHYGNVTQRYTVTEAGQQLPRRQRIQPLYDQQFELKLHKDETVVIGYQQMEDWSIGRMLFQSEELGSRSERLIALRLADVESIVGQKSVVVDYRKN